MSERTWKVAVCASSFLVRWFHSRQVNLTSVYNCITTPKIYKCKTNVGKLLSPSGMYSSSRWIPPCTHVYLIYRLTSRTYAENPHGYPLLTSYRKLNFPCMGKMWDTAIKKATPNANEDRQLSLWRKRNGEHLIVQVYLLWVVSKLSSATHSSLVASSFFSSFIRGLLTLLYPLVRNFLWGKIQS